MQEDGIKTKVCYNNNYNDYVWTVLLNDLNASCQKFVRSHSTRKSMGRRH